MKQDRNIGLKLRTDYMDQEFIHNLKSIQSVKILVTYETRLFIAVFTETALNPFLSQLIPIRKLTPLLNEIAWNKNS
jgi:hypothetical protein